jgi:ABC-2 type transport system permease protein/oleandomycin transport system permease protein
MTAIPLTRQDRWRRVLRDTSVLTSRNLRHFTRQPQLLLFSTVQPVMFVVLFAFVFGGAVEGALPAGVSYVNFLLPGILVQATAFRATQTAVGLSQDLEKGVIDRFRSMPMTPSAVLIGRTVADFVRSLFVIALMIAVGALIGFRFGGGLLPAVGAVLIVALFGVALSWIFAFVALAVPGAEAAQSAGFVAVFPLVFASSVFVPVETMPSWLQGFAEHSPVTVTVDAARAMALGLPLGSSLVQALVWIAGIVAIFLPLAVWRYRRIT